MLTSSSLLMMLGGILPRTFYKVMFLRKAGSKCCLRKGLRILREERSSVCNALFFIKASASVIRLLSSVRSLFFAISRNFKPLLKARAFAKTSKPVSVKEFLGISRCVSVVLMCKNLDRIMIPSFEIILLPRASSYRVLFSFKTSTRSLRPSSLILFPLKFKNLIVWFIFSDAQSVLSPASVI
jgi:hypothetical protein